jgi:triphosphatase
VTRGPREIELKLQLNRGSRKVIEANRKFAVVAPKRLDLLTTYFDTPDGVLRKAGLSLRVRRIGALRIQTVKAMEDRRGISTDRPEWEWPIQHDSPNLDPLSATSELRRIVPKIRGRLLPLFESRIRRTVRLLPLTEGTIVEASIDEGAIRVGARRQAVIELELELKAGPIGPLYGLASQLQKAARLWISPESKFARGLRLATGHDDTPHKPERVALKNRGSAAAGLHAILGTTLGHLVANTPLTLRGSPGGLHQMRVALRATRAALQLFEPVLDHATGKSWDLRLQRLGHLFGTGRDWDVFCLRMLPKAKRDLAHSDLRPLIRAAETERQRAHRAVEDAIRGPAFSALLLEIAQWVETGLVKPDAFGPRMDKRLKHMAPSLLNRIHSRARRKARHLGQLSALELHALRKSLKRVRYDAQSLADLFPRRAARDYRKACEGVLKILGTMNDAAMTRRLAKRLTPNAPRHLARLGLERWSLRRAARAKLELKAAVRKFKQAPLFWS